MKTIKNHKVNNHLEYTCVPKRIKAPGFRRVGDVVGGDAYIQMQYHYVQSGANKKAPRHLWLKPYVVTHAIVEGPEGKFMRTTKSLADIELKDGEIITSVKADASMFLGRHRYDAPDAYMPPIPFYSGNYKKRLLKRATLWLEDIKEIED